MVWLAVPLLWFPYTLLGEVERGCEAELAVWLLEVHATGENWDLSWRVMLTLEELALGTEVVAVVEQLGPLLGEVVAEGPDAAVEDAENGLEEGSSF